MNQEHSWERTILKEIERSDASLTEWEANFIESITRQLDQGRTLSEKQIEILNRIHDQRT